MKKNGAQRPFLYAIALAPLLIASACTGSLLESDLPPSTSYVLAPAPPATSAIAATQADLAIGRPDVAPGLDTVRIAVLKGRQLDYYRRARWGGSTIEVVQRLLVDSIEDQRLFRSVTAEQAQVAGDYVLDIEVRDFQAEYASDNDAPDVNVMIVGRLIRILDRQLVGTVISESHIEAADNRMSAVVAAFETAAHQVAIDLARKTAVAIAADAQHLPLER